MLQNHEHSTFSMKKICQNSPRNVLKKRIVKDRTEKLLKKDNSIRIFYLTVLFLLNHSSKFNF